MSSLIPYFTVFTPTYNRAHTLKGVYDSLCAQTYQNFEWVIVDDGSIDGTEDLINGWVENNLIKIVYLKQKNQGKHVAHNTGVENASGYLFLVFDSDDKCVPETLETFRKYWESIPDEVKSNYSTLSVLCMDQFGDIVGNEYPGFVVDISSFSDQLELRGGGERWGVNTTESMRENKFPVYEGERFVPEGLVWNRLSNKYWARFVNVPLRIYEQQKDSLSSKAVSLRIKSPKGTLKYYVESMSLPLSFRQKIKNASNLARFSLHAKDFSEMSRLIKKDCFILACFPVGMLCYLSDLCRKN